MGFITSFHHHLGNLFDYLFSDHPTLCKSLHSGEFFLPFRTRNRLNWVVKSDAGSNGMDSLMFSSLSFLGERKLLLRFLQLWDDPWLQAQIELQFLLFYPLKKTFSSFTLIIKSPISHSAHPMFWYPIKTVLLTGMRIFCWGSKLTWGFLGVNSSTL